MQLHKVVVPFITIIHYFFLVPQISARVPIILEEETNERRGQVKKTFEMFSFFSYNGHPFCCVKYKREVVG